MFKQIIEHRVLLLLTRIGFSSAENYYFHNKNGLLFNLDRGLDAIF